MTQICEIVKANKLKIGDEFATMHSPGMVLAAERVNLIENGTPSTVCSNDHRTLLSDEPIFRFLPFTEDPRVTQRALALMAHDLVDRGELEDGDDLDAVIRDLVREYELEEVRQELEDKAKQCTSHRSGPEIVDLAARRRARGKKRYPDENWEELKTCQFCGNTKCLFCDMGDNTDCPSCEYETEVIE